MWKDRLYIVNGEVVGSVWFRKGEKFWKWGYTGGSEDTDGFIETTEEKARKQVEELVRK